MPPEADRKSETAPAFFMKAYQIFQEMTPERAESVFQYLRDEQRDVYGASLASLAANRKLRPVFIQKKKGAEQVAWMAKNIRLRGSEEIAEHVLQLWLMQAHNEMLVQFLNGVGIEHDGEGAAEDLPDDLDAKKLKKTVDKLIADHDEELVRIYLHVFQRQRSDGFAALTKLIDETPALQFGVEKEPAPTPGPEAPIEGEAEPEAKEEETSEEE
ncbi:MAG: hypothetical protein L7V87_10460 [Verrucomicrobiales bacterium]|nr:hypothetical protein [Verrucomicrobiales bacterium]